MQLKLDDFVNVPDKEIYNILEDNKQMVWMATNSGLYSFDGYQFTHHTAPNQTGSAVFGLIKDKANNIWVSNLKGEVIRCINGNCEIITSAKTDLGVIPSIYPFKDETYVTSRYGLTVIDKNDTTKTYEIKNTTHPISNIVEFDGNLFFYHSNSLYNYKNNELTKVKTYDYIGLIYGSSKLIVVKDQLVLITLTSDGQKYFRIGNEELVELNWFPELNGLRTNAIKNVVEHLIFHTNNGMFKYSLQSEKPKLQTHLLRNDLTTDHFTDFLGNRWISTIDNGIKIMPPSHIKELHIPNLSEYHLSTFNAISDSSIVAILNKEQLVKVNLEGLELKRNINKITEQHMVIDKTKSLVYLLSDSLYTIKTKTLNTKKKKHLPSLKDLVADNQYSYAASYNRLLKLDSLLNEKKTIPGRSKVLNINTSKSHLLVQFEDDLKLVNLSCFCISETFQKFKNFKAKKILPDLTSNGFIVISEQGILYQITFKNSKWVFEPHKFSGMDSSKLKISDIAVDQSGTYALTSNGIIVNKSLNNNNNRWFNLSNYNLMDWPSIKKLKLTENYIWIGNDTKIYRFEKQQLNQTNTIPNFSIYTDVNDRFRADSIIKLSSDKNQLYVKARLTGLQNLATYVPKYKILNSKNSEWETPVFKNNNIYISNLPVGKYKLAVKYVSKFNTNETKTQFIKIEKKAPYYLRWWFILLTASILIFGASIAWYMKNKRSEKQMVGKLNEAHLKNKIATLKLENLRSQMNPHFIFNSLNSIQDYILSSNKELASDYLSRFSKLIRIYLSHSQLSHVSLEVELQTLELYIQLEKNRFDNGFEHQINVDKSINLNTIEVPSLFLQPYVENAINHGLYHSTKSNKKLTIDITTGKTSTLIIITDNGIGRAASAFYNQNDKHNNFSMKANTNRVELINAFYKEDMNVVVEDLYKNNNSQGTKVIIEIPVK